MSAPDPVSRFDSAGATHVGLVRKLNEDAWLARPDLGLWVVADGMGGHAAGDVASRMIVSALDSIGQARGAAGLIADVKARLQGAHDRLRAQTGGDRVMGSTVVALIIAGDRFVCLWAGDSRLYLLRGGTLTQVTHDHSHVQDLVDAGLLRAEDADHHPQANVITRAVGAAETLELEERSSRLEPGDVLLLCSDGLSRTVPEGEIRDALANGPADATAPALIDLALQHGTRDNVSAVVVRCPAGTGSGVAADPAAADPAAADPGDGDEEPTLPPADDKEDTRRLARGTAGYGVVPPGSATADGWASVGRDADGDATLPPGTGRTSDVAVLAPDRQPSAVASSEAAGGQSFAGYTVLSKLGEGAVAEAFQAVAPDERIVALKILRPEVAGHAAFVARFLGGAEAARRLDHPAIAAVLDVGRNLERPYIATAFVDGLPLDQVHGAGEPWPLAAALAVARQIAEALAHAHEQDVVHGGLKPDNVLIDRDGRAVVTDFAVPSVDDAALSGAASSGFIQGTPRYLSPEQVHGRPADERSDLFALGVILYHLLTGRAPFAAETLDDLIDRIARHDPPPIAQLANDVPRGVVRIVDQLLQKAPERRPTSAAAVAQALAREEKRPAGSGDPLPRWVPWAAVAAALAAAVAVFAALAL